MDYKIVEHNYYTASIYFDIVNTPPNPTARERQKLRRRYYAIATRMLNISGCMGLDDVYEHEFVSIVSYKSTDRALLQDVLTKTVNWLKSQPNVVIVQVN